MKKANFISLNKIKTRVIKQIRIILDILNETNKSNLNGFIFKMY